MNVWNLVDDSTPYIVILITYLLVSATDEDCDYQVQDDMCFAFYSFYSFFILDFFSMPK